MNGDVQFKEEWRPQQFIPKKGWGEKLAGLIVKYSGGLIKDEQQASYVILGLVVVAIIISLFLFFGGGGGGGPKTIPRFREDIEPEVRTKLPPGVLETIPSKYDR